MLLSILITLFLAASSSALVIDAINDAVQFSSSYDFIVVGAGIGGSVMASRLSENPQFNVLLIEAGISELDIPNLEIPMMAPRLASAQNGTYTWNYVTTPQRELGGRAFPYPRGKLAGGSSGINFMLINKGTSQEWDRFASVTGDAGWSFKNMKTYLNKFEQMVPPQDGRSLKGDYTPSAHGTRGVIKTTIGNHIYPADHRLIASANSKFPFNQDINAGDSALGLGWMPSATGGGYRNSAATGYLRLNNVIDRPNLIVLLNAHVTNLEFHNGSSSQVSGVSWATSSTAARYTVLASKEVILSGGSINTPQLLMLSGIGPKGLLKGLNITCIADLPVGQGLVDHPLVRTVWEITPTAETNDGDNYNSTILSQDIDLWRLNKTGRASTFSGGVFAWSRLPAHDPLWKKHADPSAGDKTPHIENIFANGWSSSLEMPPTEGRYLTTSHIIVSPASRGEVTLVSNDPWHAPKIDPGFLTNELDRHMLIQSITNMRDFLENAAPLKGFLGKRYGANAVADTQERISKLLTSYVTTIWHPSSTAPMSKKGAKSGVTNPDLTVKGISGLRIVDLSVFPYISAGHPSGYLYALSERAADIVKAKYSCASF